MMPDGAFDYLGKADPKNPKNASGGFHVGQVVFSEYHKKFGMLTAVDGADLWFNADGWTPDHSVLLHPEHVKPCPVNSDHFDKPFTPGELAYSDRTKRVGKVLKVHPEDGILWGWPSFAQHQTPIWHFETELSRKGCRKVNMALKELTPAIASRMDAFGDLMIKLGDIKPRLESRYLVKGWIDRGAFSVVYGPSNVGKTFFALDLAMHVAAAKDWHGHKVPGNGDYAGRVVYVAGEGGFGIMNRIEAIRRARPDLMEYTEANGDFILLPTTLDLCGETDGQALASVLQSLDPALVVIDTLAMAFGGGDENTAKDMGAFIRNCGLIREDTGAHVMVIHHTGKDSDKGARGSNSLRAATDTEIELSREGEIIFAKPRKQRDMPMGDPFAYTLHSVFLGYDEDGDAVTSAIVEPTEATPKIGPQLKGQKLTCMQAFGDALAKHGKVMSDAERFPANRQCVAIEHWREECRARGLSDGSAESSFRAAFSKKTKELQEDGVVCILDGYAWRVTE